jgi:phosphatidate cytidylyltransferase
MVHLGLLEYFRLAQFKGIRPASKTTLVLVQLLLITTQWAHGGDAVGVGLAADLAEAVLPISGALICGWLLLQPLTGSIADIAASIFALFYLGFLPSYWIRLRDLTDPALAPRLAGWLGHWPGASSGMVLMLMACLLIVATDIGSYVLGRRYGRRPLSPISPGKTLEGALGGLGCAVLLGAGFGLLLGWNWGWAVGGLLGAVVAVFALVGDLTESMMKRDAGVKDSGDLLPGHGGILDRIDSYLFTPAAFYTVVTLLAPLLR